MISQHIFCLIQECNKSKFTQFKLIIKKMRMKLLYEKLKTTRSMLMLLLLGIFLLATAVVQAQNVTVATDRDDYWPGSWVHITGTGWQPGETVQIEIRHLVFTLHQTDVFSLTAQSDGTIDNNAESKLYFIDEDELGESFLLIATGLPGEKAETTFTDSGVAGIVPSTYTAYGPFTITANGINTSNNPYQLCFYNGSVEVACVPLTLDDHPAYQNLYGNYPLLPPGSYTLYVYETKNGVWKLLPGDNTVDQQIITCTAPTIDCPSGTSADANASCEAPVPDYSAGATVHNGCGTVNVTQSPGAGTLVGPGDHTITLTATDSNNSTGICSLTFTVVDNTPPVIADCPVDITVMTGPGRTTCDKDVSWTEPTATDNCTAPGSLTWSKSHIPGSVFPVGTTLVTYTATDAASNTSLACTFNVIVVDNTPPSILCAPDVSVNNDAGLCSAVVVLNSPAIDDNCGVDKVVNDHPSTTFPVATTIVVWTVTDIHGNTNSCEQKVVVTDNEAPTTSCAPDVTVTNDAGLCSAVVVLNPPATDDNCGVDKVVNDHPSTTFPVATTIVVWTVTDIHGNTNTCEQKVVVTNIAPVISLVTVPTVPLPVGTLVTLKVDYVDNNVTNATINWDDGIISNVPVSTNPFITTHTYTIPGVNSVSVTLTDACGLTATYIYDYIVVYDPNAGFVTGGGWIMSPVGAYIPDKTLTGKANFGFVSKYQKGKTIPDGNTEFQFHAAGMNFKSSVYEWLVVASMKAQFKGSGTLNGSGNYGFMLSAIDGNPDKFRIKIWNKDAGDAVVYDNQMAAPLDADPTTAISGGSIVVHTSNKSAEVILPVTDKTNLLVYPNPFSDKLWFEFVAPADMHARINLYDVTGRMMQTVFDNEVKAGINYNADFVPSTNTSGMYFYRMTLGEEVFNGKVMYKK
jgi:hypothetical protein